MRFIITESVGYPNYKIDDIKVLCNMTKDEFIANPVDGYVYIPNGSNRTCEATANITKGVIELSDKFFEYDEYVRRHILIHENMHFFTEKISSDYRFHETILNAIWNYVHSYDGLFSYEKNVDEVITDILAYYVEGRNPSKVIQDKFLFEVVAPSLLNLDLDISHYGNLSDYLTTHKTYPDTELGHQLEMYDDVISTNPELAKQRGWDKKANALRKLLNLD